MEACTNPDILRVIWFFMIILDIVKIIIPIGLIILGLVDFSKAMITSDENTQKKSGKLFGKRIIYAILVFAVPWLIEVFMITLGNLIGEEGSVNFTDCLENANGDMIEMLETNSCLSGIPFKINYYNENGNSIDESVVKCSSNMVVFKNDYIKKAGFKYKGWVSKDDSSEYFWTAGAFISHNISDAYAMEVSRKFDGLNLIPVYEEITLDNCGTPPYKITLYNSLDEQVLGEIEFCPGQITTLPSFEVPGYRFIGWTWKFRNDEESIIEAGEWETPFSWTISEMDRYYENHDLKAIYKKEITLENCQEDTYEIEFYDATLLTKAFPTKMFCPGQFIQLPSYEVEGRVFKGWTYKGFYHHNLPPIDPSNEWETPTGTELKSLLYHHDGKLALAPVFE